MLATSSLKTHPAPRLMRWLTLGYAVTLLAAGVAFSLLFERSKCDTAEYIEL